MELLPGTETSAHDRLHNTDIIFVHPKQFRHDPSLLIRCLGVAPNIQFPAVRKIADTGCGFHSHMLHG